MLKVGIGEYALSNNPVESIITYALGSCIALIIYCPKTKYTALAHIVLPENRNNYNDDLSIKKPSYFAEDIVPKLLEFFIAEKDCPIGELKISMIGGAESLNKKDVFMVGKKMLRG